MAPVPVEFGGFGLHGAGMQKAYSGYFTC